MQITPEEKRKVIKRLKEGMDNLRGFLDILERDIKSKDLNIQTSSIWISSQLLSMVSGFLEELKTKKNDNKEQ